MKTLKKHALLTILTIALTALPSCAPLGGQENTAANNAQKAKLELVTVKNTKDKAGSKALAVRRTDDKKVPKKEGLARVMYLTPGFHKLECELTKLDSLHPQVMVCSQNPIILGGEFKAGKTYRVEIGSLDLPPSKLGSNTLAHIGDREAIMSAHHTGSPRLIEK
jgi:hypothetical protein